MKRLLLAVMSVIALSAAPVHAEGDFVNHIDLFQPTTATSAAHGAVAFGDFGYHFTAVQLGRVELLGAGLMFDVYERDEPQDATSSIKVDTLVTAHVIGIALKDPKGNDAWASFGVRYAYNLNAKAHGVILGFSVSFR